MLQLRGELGILKKKVGGFQGRIEELQGQLQHTRDLEGNLHQVQSHCLDHLFSTTT